MRLIIDQPLAVSAEQAQAVLADPAFYRSLGALPNISVPEVRAQDVSDRQARLVLGYHFDGRLSGPARRVLDPAKISWAQYSEADLAERRTEVKMVPDHYQGLFSFEAWYRIDPRGSAASTQHFEADLRVHLPLLGPLAERAIASGIRENLAATALLVERYAAGGA